MIIYLVRHAMHALVGNTLCGRRADIALSEQGGAQAERLAGFFSGRSIDVVQSSPRRRARETAAPIAEAMGKAVETADPMDEHDAGDWSGRSFEDLSSDAEWIAWNNRRGTGRPPGGESMSELQYRVLMHLAALAARGDGSAVVVSHAEPIRAALLHFLALPFDRFAEVEVAPASISVLQGSGTSLRAGEINVQVVS